MIEIHIQSVLLCVTFVCRKQQKISTDTYQIMTQALFVFARLSDVVLFSMSKCHLRKKNLSYKPFILFCGVQENLQQ